MFLGGFVFMMKISNSEILLSLTWFFLSFIFYIDVEW